VETDSHRGQGRTSSLLAFSFAGNASVIHDDKEKRLRRIEKEMKRGMDNDRQGCRARARVAVHRRKNRVGHSTRREFSRGREMGIEKEPR